MKPTAKTNAPLKTTGLLLVILFLILTSVGAQLKTDELSNFVVLDKSFIKTMIASERTNEYIEKELEFEDWMTDLDKWSKVTDSASGISFEKEMQFEEEELQLENWMMEPNWIRPDVKNKKEIQIESWMINPVNWIGKGKRI